MRPVVLVTGGAGYIGSHVCKALAMSGFQPVTYDNLSQGHRWAVRWGPLERGSLIDASHLDIDFERYRPRAVMHLAAHIAAGESVNDPGKYYWNNVLGTLNLINAMRRSGVDRIVFASSAAVYGNPLQLPLAEDHPVNPINPYGASKLMGERMLRDYAMAYGIRSASLRYFDVVGADASGEIGEFHEPETHLVPLVLEAGAGRRPCVTIFGDDFPTRDGTCIRDYVDVNDAAFAQLLALRFLDRYAGAHIFNIGIGMGATVLEVIDAAKQVMGRPISVEVAARRSDDPPALVADSAKARKALKWDPEFTDLRRQIASAWRWQRRMLALTA